MSKTGDSTIDGEAIRSEIDEVLVSGSSQTNVLIHIPDPDGPEPRSDEGHDTDAFPICQRLKTTPSDWLSKRIECYPPGYCDWCSLCIRAWEDEIMDDEEDSGWDPLAE